MVEDVISSSKVGRCEKDRGIPVSDLQDDIVQIEME
jgi:hypothetical protein